MYLCANESHSDGCFSSIKAASFLVGGFSYWQVLFFYSQLGEI
jgi:hypothetical protein